MECMEDLLITAAGIPYVERVGKRSRTEHTERMDGYGMGCKSANA